MKLPMCLALGGFGSCVSDESSRAWFWSLWQEDRRYWLGWQCGCLMFIWWVKPEFFFLDFVHRSFHWLPCWLHHSVFDRCYLNADHLTTMLWKLLSGGSMPSKLQSGQTLLLWSWAKFSRWMETLLLQFAAPPQYSHTTKTSFHSKESVVQHCDHVFRSWDSLVWVDCADWTVSDWKSPQEMLINAKSGLFWVVFLFDE